MLGLGSYETAWTWLHKLRRAMVRPGRDRLNGIVEVDKTYVGGPEKDKWGREIESKAIVAIAAEENGQGIGRVRLHRIKDVSAASLIPFAQSAVAPGATIHTDGWSGYAGLEAAGYRHKVSIISTSTDAAHEAMPRVHKVASLLKRWLLGTHQGGIQRQHLDYYLDEFTSASTAAARTPGVSCSTVSPSKPSPSIWRPTARSSESQQIRPIPTGQVSEGDTHFNDLESPIGDQETPRL